MKDGAIRKWVEHFPPMPTGHKYAVVFCSGKALVVAGGRQTINLAKLTDIPSDPPFADWARIFHDRPAYPLTVLKSPHSKITC